MKSSDAVRSTMLRFYERLTASDIEGFDALVSDDAPTLVTAPHRTASRRDRSGGSWTSRRCPIRTARRSGRGSPRSCTGRRAIWRLIHMHVSVGVPDDEVVTLQRRWSPAS